MNQENTNNKTIKIIVGAVILVGLVIFFSKDKERKILDKIYFGCQTESYLERLSEIIQTRLQIEEKTIY